MAKELKTIGQAKQIVFDGERKINATKQELSSLLEDAARFNRGFFDEGYEDAAKGFQAVLTRIALRNDIQWNHLTIPGNKPQ